MVMRMKASLRLILKLKSNKVKELNDINSDCHNYVSKIKDSVNAIVGNDQLLASQIAGVI